MCQLHQSDLVLCFDTASLAPRPNALLLGTDRGDVGDRGAVAGGWCIRLLRSLAYCRYIYIPEGRVGGGRYHIVMNCYAILSIGAISRILVSILIWYLLILILIHVPQGYIPLAIAVLNPAFTGCIAPYLGHRHSVGPERRSRRTVVGNKSTFVELSGWVHGKGY